MFIPLLATGQVITLLIALQHTSTEGIACNAFHLIGFCAPEYKASILYRHSDTEATTAGFYKGSHQEGVNGY